MRRFELCLRHPEKLKVVLGIPWASRMQAMYGFKQLAKLINGRLPTVGLFYVSFQ